MREDNNNIDGFQKPDVLDVFCGFAEEMRNTELYKEFEHKMMRKTRDWREEYYKVCCRYLEGERGDLIMGEVLRWLTLFTDPKYNKRKKFELLLDLDDYVGKNGVRIDVTRSKEFHDRLIKYIQECETQKSCKAATQTIDRDSNLLELFKYNEAIYDKFFERCLNKKNYQIVNELIAVFSVLEINEDAVTKSALREQLEELGFNVAKDNSTFNSAFCYQQNKKKYRRGLEINTAKKEYKKLAL